MISQQYPCSNMEQTSSSPATSNAIRGAEQSGNIAKQRFTTREKASSNAGFRCISSAGTGASNKALQLTLAVARAHQRYCYTCVAAGRYMEARYC